MLGKPLEAQRKPTDFTGVVIEDVSGEQSRQAHHAHVPEEPQTDPFQRTDPWARKVEQFRAERRQKATEGNVGVALPTDAFPASQSSGSTPAHALQTGTPAESDQWKNFTPTGRSPVELPPFAVQKYRPCHCYARGICTTMFCVCIGQSAMALP